MSEEPSNTYHCCGPSRPGCKCNCPDGPCDSGCKNCMHKAIADAVAAAYEDAAKVAEAEEELDGDPPQEVLAAILANPAESLRSTVRCTKRNIAAAIRARSQP